MSQRIVQRLLTGCGDWCKAAKTKAYLCSAERYVVSITEAILVACVDGVRREQVVGILSGGQLPTTMAIRSTRVAIPGRAENPERMDTLGHIAPRGCARLALPDLGPESIGSECTRCEVGAVTKTTKDSRMDT